MAAAVGNRCDGLMIKGGGLFGCRESPGKFENINVFLFWAVAEGFSYLITALALACHY